MWCREQGRGSGPTLPEKQACMNQICHLISINQETIHESKNEFSKFRGWKCKAKKIASIELTAGPVIVNMFDGIPTPGFLIITG